MKFGLLSIIALSTLAFATCGKRPEDSMSETTPMAAIDLAKEANQEKQTSWTGKAIADIVDISQVEKIIVLDSVSSATPQTLSVVIVGILSEDAAFEDAPQAVGRQRAPTVQALIMLKDGDFLRVTVWKGWGASPLRKEVGAFGGPFLVRKRTAAPKLQAGCPLRTSIL